MSVIMHVKEPQLSIITVGHCVLSPSFCVFLYSLHVLNRDITVIQTNKSNLGINSLTSFFITTRASMHVNGEYTVAKLPIIVTCVMQVYIVLITRQDFKFLTQPSARRQQRALLAALRPLRHGDRFPLPAAGQRCLLPGSGRLDEPFPQSQRERSAKGAH